MNRSVKVVFAVTLSAFAFSMYAKPAKSSAKKTEEKEPVYKVEAKENNSKIDSTKKRGFCFEVLSDAQVIQLENGGKVSWAYNWGTNPQDKKDGSSSKRIGGRGAKIAYFPMMWGDLSESEEKLRVYNVEMQATRTGHLPKRSRYYAGQVDINQLNRGQEYDQLKPTYIIFICKFDPFGKGLYQYTFCNKCDEVDGLELGDESYKIFLNTAGTKERPDEKDSSGKTEGNSSRISDGMKELLRYMNNTKDYPVESAQYDLIKKIDAAVAHAKQDEEWRRAYMTYQANQREAELRGEARGDERRAKESALSMYNDGLTVEKISKYVGYAVDVVKKWVGITV